MGRISVSKRCCDWSSEQGSKMWIEMREVDSLTFLWGTWVSLGRQKYFPLTLLQCLSGCLGDVWSFELLPEQPCSVHNTLFQWVFFSEQTSVARIDIDFRVLFCQRNIKHKTRQFFEDGKDLCFKKVLRLVFRFFMYYPTQFCENL